MPRPKRDGFSFNGVQLGLGSPLINAPPRRRYVGPSEHQIQCAAVDRLLGKFTREGLREPGAGCTGQHPELALLYAVPNGGHRLPVAAAKAKAEGQLVGMADLVLPVPRYPFHGLYLEVKVPGKRARPEQRAVLEALVGEGYAVADAQGTDEVVDVVLEYLELPRWPAPEELLERRRRILAQLQPRPLLSDA
ncbi:MAG: VRR-NUC domain-containing protein [Gaiellaceae bacterium]